MPYNALQCSAMPQDILKILKGCLAVPCDALQCLQCPAMPCSALECPGMPCNALQCLAMPFNPLHKDFLKILKDSFIFEKYLEIRNRKDIPILKDSLALPCNALQTDFLLIRRNSP
mgnify:CR=1 FL=1